MKKILYTHYTRIFSKSQNKLQFFYKNEVFFYLKCGDKKAILEERFGTNKLQGVWIG
jgi:hypothetical protein